MSVCGRVAFGDSDGRQWRGRPPRATDAAGFSQGFCVAYPAAIALSSRRRPEPYAAARRPQKAVRCPSRDHERLGLWAPTQVRGRINQVFSSDLIRLSNSSNEVSPLILSPLMKKVGVESTFSTSLAYF